MVLSISDTVSDRNTSGEKKKKKKNVQIQIPSIINRNTKKIAAAELLLDII